MDFFQNPFMFFDCNTVTRNGCDCQNMDDNGMSRYMEKRLNSESRTMLASTMPSRERGRVKLNNDEEGGIKLNCHRYSRDSLA